MNEEAARPGEAPLVSRRRWIDILLGTSLAAWAAAVLYPIVRYLTPEKGGGGAGKVSLTDAQKQELIGNGFVIARIGSDRVIVIKDPAGKLHALSAKCTHEGCTVQFVPANDLVWCACHNGKFSVDGRVISGPPPRPLATFVVEGDLKGTVTVTRPGAAA